MLTHSRFKTTICDWKWHQCNFPLQLLFHNISNSSYNWNLFFIRFLIVWFKLNFRRKKNNNRTVFELKTRHVTKLVFIYVRNDQKIKKLYVLVCFVAKPYSVNCKRSHCKSFHFFYSHLHFESAFFSVSKTNAIFDH